MDNKDLEAKELALILIKRIKETGFIIMSALVLFMLLSLGSYHPGDPGWSHTGINSEPLNVAGLLGSYIADIVLSLFGYFGYFIPVMIAGIFSILLKGVDFKSRATIFGLKILGAIILTVSSCGLANLYLPEIENVIPQNSGGVIGNFISLFTLKLLGKLGSTLLLTAIFMIGISIVTNLSWLQILNLISDVSVYFLQKLKSVIKFCAFKFVFYARKIAVSIFKYCKQKSMLILSAIKNKVFKSSRLNFFTTKKNSLENNSVIDSSKFITPVIESSNHYADDTKLDIKPITAELDKSASLQERLAAFKAKKKSMSGQNNDLNIENNIQSKPAYKFPEASLLQSKQIEINKEYKHLSKSVLEELSSKVENILADFGIEAHVESVYPGPVITRFELSLKAGIKASRVSGLVKDIARSLLVGSVRVVEVIPGKSVIGLEIPNQDREIVKLKEIIESEPYKNSGSDLTLALGKDIAGSPIVADLAKMPHLLVAGTTGSGKSVGVNAMLLSILYKSTPYDVRLLLIDPKMLELSVYEGIPHLLSPVVTDMKDAFQALNWCVGEMERRYQLMAAVGVRNLAGFNDKIMEAIEIGNPIKAPLHCEDNNIFGENSGYLNKLPRIVVIIDEFADMMMVVGKKVEELIARIAQKARAAGIHMILATQRPSVDVITGLIKANIPTRIGFQVSSKIDSRTILDQMGAEQLLGNGDMLYLPPGSGVPERVHGAFVSDQEVHNVVGYLKSKAKPNYIEEICFNSPTNLNNAFSSGNMSNDFEETDELYDEAVAIVAESRKTSVSYLQRRLKIGYNRAARLVETMEQSGVLSPMQSNGAREILISSTN